MPKTATLFCLFTVMTFTRLLAVDAYWQQFVHYEIDVTLIPVEHALIGQETITYTNNSPDTLRHIYLHLYPNAFRNNQSVQAREALQYYQKLVPNPASAGYLNIESFRISPAGRAGKNGHTASRVTAFDIEDTILSAKLPFPLPPGDSLVIQLSFYHKIRKHNGRAGYRGVQYDLAQWYPKVCVYDENGWDNEPFHYLGEFYGEFGTFDVTITTPFEYIIAATGEVTEGDPGWNIVKIDTALSASKWAERREEIYRHLHAGSRAGKLRTVHFHARKVHDFAWMASSDFLYESGEWQGIPIHVVYRSYARRRWHKRVIRGTVRALDWLDKKFGRYPYPQVTVGHGLLRGGMEYPMLVMNCSDQETLILHEIGHIYFYGALANNERKEAWLDEGFTTFQTRWYAEERYGPTGFDRDTFMRRANWLQRHRPFRTRRELNRDQLLAFMNSGHDEPLSQNAWDYKEPLSYSRNAYDKGAFFFDMLKYVVGDSTFEAICKTYFERWKFKHVNEQRFRQVCNEVSGGNLNWFFKQWLHSTPTVDYQLAKTRKKKTEDGWQTEATILRNGEGTLPVEVQVTTRSGEVRLKRWNGLDRIGSVVLNTKEKPTRIVLDPNDKILDLFPLNNRPFRIRTVFDYPGMSYSPRDAYLITWRPSGWYNEVDGLRFGGRLKGRYGRHRNTEAGLWVGTESGVVDGLFKYSNPIKALGDRTTGSIGFQKMEGRLEMDGHLSFIKSRNLQYPPQQRFKVGFNHSRLLSGSEDYVLREFDQKNDTSFVTWDPGDVDKLYFRYSINPRGLNWFSVFNLGFDTSQEDWGSDFTFTSLFGELKVATAGRRQGLNLRIYGRYIGDSDDAPVQDLIFLNGANPRQRFSRFFLRSEGGLPEELHYQLPGGANLRGYYNNPLVADRVVALNLEAHRQFGRRFLGSKIASLLGDISAAGFIDVASVEFLDTQNQVLADAGVGLRFNNILPDDWYTIFTGGRQVTLRLDFPIWVSQSLPDENNLRFRWVFGFEQAF